MMNDEALCQLQAIVSGGQAGVDRGALDAALELGFPCGGWCPPGRLAEDGAIPACYPLRELHSGGYRERTIRNIVDSDGTLVVRFGQPEGGTALTIQQCERRGRPHLSIDAATVPVDEAVELVRGFLVRYRIATLNVAGPRASKEPMAHAYAYRLMLRVLRLDRA